MPQRQSCALNIVLITQTLARDYTRGSSPGTAAEVERTQRALGAATTTTLQRKRRVKQARRDIAEAESAVKRAVAAAATAREALLRSTHAAAMGVSATPPLRQTSRASTRCRNDPWRTLASSKELSSIWPPSGERNSPSTSGKRSLPRHPLS